MVKMEIKDGLKEVMKLRLLSKSWHQAFIIYGGWSANIFLNAKGSAHLQTVCELLRDLSGLEIRLTEKNINFSPIFSLTRLTSLELSTYFADNPDPYQKTFVSMSMLPPSLKKLILYHAELRHMDEMHLPCLTRLDVQIPSEEDCNEDLAQLTKLQLLEVGLPIVCCLKGVDRNKRALRIVSNICILLAVRQRLDLVRAECL